MNNVRTKVLFILLGIVGPKWSPYAAEASLVISLMHNDYSGKTNLSAKHNGITIKDFIFPFFH